MFIYSLTNRINGKRYIGQTTRSVEWRWRQHRKHMNSVDFPIYHALRKYGVDNFDVEVLAAACSVACLNHLEALFIAAYNSLVPHGYNLDSGGKSNVAHPDTLARMSAAKKGRKFTEEHRAKIGAAFKGRTLSFEQRARLSGGRRGREVSVEEYQQIYAAKHSRKGRRTHCRQGHLLPEDRFELSRNHHRCRTCMLEYQRNYDRTVRKALRGKILQ